MAEQTVEADEVLARGTLVGGTTDTITFSKDLDTVSVAGDGTAEILFTVDGTEPDIASKTTYRIFASGGWNSAKVDVPTAGNTEVKVKSSGTPEYEVSS